MFDKYCSMGYRNDIQGVRALGAILIMIFHIWVNKASGGVDVFFVISGFLMSFILLRGYFKDNIINAFLFWGSIVKRIAPFCLCGTRGYTFCILFNIGSELLVWIHK